MTEPRRDPWLLTPGPLTTSRTVKEAMLRDWGSRDAEFIKLNARVRERLVELAGGDARVRAAPGQRDLHRGGDARHARVPRGQGRGARERRLREAHGAHLRVPPAPLCVDRD